jgi:hypothetical protein
MSWTLTISLVVGLLCTVSSAASMPGSSPGEDGGMQHCQWMTPAACCDQPLAVSGSNTLPKPAVTIALLAPLPSLGAAPWTPGSASISGEPFYQRTIVLRL